jgi:hypothetical protein
LARTDWCCSGWPPRRYANRANVVEFESAAQILNEWRLPVNGEYYRRLADTFKRVFASTIFFGTSQDRRGSEVWNCTRVHFFDQVRLWFKDEGGKDVGRRENLVTLSAPFWEELKNHPIPVDADVVRVLANNPRCLDLYTWLTWRCYQAKSAERIPLFGPFGLAAQLGSRNTLGSGSSESAFGAGSNWFTSTGPSARQRCRAAVTYSNWHTVQQYRRDREYWYDPPPALHLSRPVLFSLCGPSVPGVLALKTELPSLQRFNLGISAGCALCFHVTDRR